ncbi:MAG: hypothetical protein E6G95_16360 [Alphaproteobacteria bacterium]|nr:MAG: hypothetical protein E6G95_16360 [Alphaproteobacteria bacterium]
MVFPGSGLAQSSGGADPDPWRVNAVLYGWAINISGNVTARNQTLDTNASTLDLLQKSNSLTGFMGYFEADKGRAGLYADLVYANLGFGADHVGYRNPIFGLKITTTASAALTYQLFIADVGGLYEIVRWPGADGSSTAIDGLLGFRYWNNSIAATFDATANINFSNLHIERSFGLAVARSDVVQWVDPVFGLRLRHRFTPNQEIFVRGDIGGFGLGSQFTWQAVAAYSYAWQFTGYQIAAAVGFRALGVNYTSGSGVDTVGINEVLYGPVIGASFRF